jgi:hypothetical protein
LSDSNANYVPSAVRIGLVSEVYSWRPDSEVTSFRK